MNVSSLGVLDGVTVFCQLTGNAISTASCLQTQGQDGCFGCASPVRHCSTCTERYVAVPATGMCSACTKTRIAEERPIDFSSLPSRVECQIMGREIDTPLCQSMQGQEECRNCIVPTRVCENCNELPIVFQQYGYCLTCSVSELQPDWYPDAPDLDVTQPGLLGSASLGQINGDELITPLAREMRRVPLSQINDPSYQLRKHLDEAALDELGQSMVSDKIISLPVLEQVGDNKYEVVIGSRRVESARRKGVFDIPVLTMGPLDTLTKLVVMLAENMHRVDLDPFEEGRVFIKLQADFELSVNDIARRLKKPTSYITERVQLHSLPTEVQALVVSDQLSIKHASALARVPIVETQVALAEESVVNRFSIGQFRRRVDAEIGRARNEPNRVISYQVTAKKAAAKMRESAEWLLRAIARIQEQDLTEEEKAELLSSLTKWRVAADHLEGYVTGSATQTTLKHGADWTSDEIHRITADDRPSDEQLATDLRRTIEAIQTKRRKLLDTE